MMAFLSPSPYRQAIGKPPQQRRQKPSDAYHAPAWRISCVGASRSYPHKPTTTTILPSSRCGTQNTYSTSVPLLLHSVQRILLVRILSFHSERRPFPLVTIKIPQGHGRIWSHPCYLCRTLRYPPPQSSVGLFQKVHVQSTLAPSLQSANQHQARRRSVIQVRLDPYPAGL